MLAARHHGRAVELDDQEHGFDRGLPLLDILLGLGKFLDVVAGILEGDELATTGKGKSVRRTAGSNPAEISSARRAPRRFPVRRHALASIEAAIFLCRPIPLITPFLKIGLGSLR
jgi:hypothetical protein